MSAVDDVGGLLGSRVGSYVGGAVGELFGPEAILLGARIGSQVEAFGGRWAGAWIASHMSNANNQAESTTQENPAQACTSCLQKLEWRYDFCKTRGKDRTKDKSTMVDFDNAGDVDSDIKDIQSGNVPKQSGTYTVSGRTYDVHDQALYPESRPDLNNVSRATHNVLEQLNSNGYDAAMNRADRSPDVSKQDVSEALKFWNKCPEKTQQLEASMSRKHEGRDVFISGVETAEQVKEVFSYAFALRADQMFLEDYAQDEYLNALRKGDVITIYELDARGTFRFKIEMEFNPSIDLENFRRGAEKFDISLAYSVDESRDDYDYYVVSRDGVTVRQLSFIDVDDTYICSLVW